LETIATKEIALAALGGAAGIAGLLLVFVGFIIIKVEALPGETSDRMLRKYDIVARLGMLPLFVLTTVILAAYGWLFYPASSLLFFTWSAGFVVGMVLFLVYSIAAILMV
jgi:hypothetical protein